jgi:hypothetical protein
MTQREATSTEYLWVTGRSTPLSREPLRLQTVLPEAGGIDQTKTPNVPNPKHNVSVFYEGRIHDWDWKDGVLTYYTRILNLQDFQTALNGDEFVGGVWLRIEYASD